MYMQNLQFKYKNNNNEISFIVYLKANADLA